MQHRDYSLHSVMAWRDGMGGGQGGKRGERGRGDNYTHNYVCIIMANLHCCMAETNTTLQKLKSGKKGWGIISMNCLT